MRRQPGFAAIATLTLALGIAIVPYQSIAREVRAGQFFCARIEGHELVRETGWVYARANRVPRMVQENLDLIFTIIWSFAIANTVGAIFGALVTSLALVGTVGSQVAQQVLIGVAAHDKAGPAVTLSFALAGLACVFAALCYAEFASMAPVAAGHSRKRSACAVHGMTVSEMCSASRVPKMKALPASISYSSRRRAAVTHALTVCSPWRRMVGSTSSTSRCERLLSAAIASSALSTVLELPVTPNDREVRPGNAP